MRYQDLCGQIRGTDTAEDLAAWEAFLTPVRVEFPHTTVRFIARLAEDQLWVCMEGNSIKDMHTGEWTAFSGSLMTHTARPDGTTLSWLYAILSWHTQHELGSNFRVNDDRPFDPHMPGPAEAL